MKKILFIAFLFLLIGISLVFAAQGESGAVTSSKAGSDDSVSGSAGSNTNQTGQGTGNGTQVNTETQTQNKGENTQLQNQVRVESGIYTNKAGEQMQIQSGEGNELKIQVSGVEAKSKIQVGSEFDPVQNRTMLKTKLSNGKDTEIKVMPNTASQQAIERLRLKVCNSENNCQIELKEVGSGEQIKVAYEVQAQKEARVLGIFKTKMSVQAQVDAESGETIQAKKPWWAFLASE
ncbi:MAG: hypothetical protein ACP5OG_03450 [Candidatus Nanoarchaeia archaeon]